MQELKNRLALSFPLLLQCTLISLSLLLRKSPASDLLKKAAKVQSAAKNPGKEVAGSVTKEQILEIVRIKMKDLNAYDEEAAYKIIAGSARSMGLEVKG